MSTVITAAGETLIAQKHISGEALVIDRIILANIPGLDVSLPVDPEQGKPAANKIVYDYVISEDYKGFVNPNQVVYSMLLGSEVGNFQFNWLGLFSSAENALVAVTHLPVTEKWQTDKANNTLGNNLTRNFLLQFSGAKAVTNITVEAKTWQVDFTARLRSIDDRERLSNRDIYGRSCFFNDGFKLVKEGGKYKLKAGVGYVDGLNCVLKSDLQIAVSALPKNVFIDVSLQQQGSNIVPVIVPKIGSNWEDYTDGNNVRHYCIKVAAISSAGVIKDVRRAEGVTSDLVEYLKRRTDTHANRKDDPHNTLAKVRALFSSSTTNASSSSIATPLAIKTVNDNLSTHKSTNDPHGVVAKVKALLTSSTTSSSTTSFSTPRAVKTVNDSLNAHKSSNDPHGVVAKVKALLSNSTTSSSTTTFATPKAVKTVNDSLNAHKAGNDPHGVVAKVRALLTSSVTSTSTTMFATPKAVKTVNDWLNSHKATAAIHVPTGGSVGDCLKKTAGGAVWGSAGLKVSDFPAQLQEAGWQKLPSGLLLQWAEVGTYGGSGFWTFPIAFPHRCLQVFSSQDREGYVSGAAPDTTNSTTLKTRAKLASTYTYSEDGFYALAIGY